MQVKILVRHGEQLLDDQAPVVSRGLGSQVKCKIYLQGVKFKLVVDHKPIIPILNSFTVEMIYNLCLQRLKEKLTSYKFGTVWKEHSIPDAISRAQIADPTEEDCFTDELNCLA